MGVMGGAQGSASWLASWGAGGYSTAGVEVAHASVEVVLVAARCRWHVWK